MFLLKQLLQDKLAMLRAQSGTDNYVIELAEKALLEKAKRINITNINSFLNSSYLQQNSFFYDAGRKIIGYKF